MIKKTSLSKYVLFGMGIFILALGISLTILSDLGTSPFDALLVGLSLKIGLTVGSWEIIIALLLIFCNSLLQSQKPEFSGLVTALLTGISIDMWLYYLSHFIMPEWWIWKILSLCVGLILIGVGTALYLHTQLAPIPVDKLMLIITDLTKRSILFSRTLIYLSFLLLAFIFQGPIGIGTLVTVCLGGPILNTCIPLIARILNSMSNENHEVNTE
jgi:uncharacterized protein